jgi:hypothetical protein
LKSRQRPVENYTSFLSGAEQGPTPAVVMVAFPIKSAFGPGASPPRLCLCCGEPTATRSIPACWDHWIALPEDLRSSIMVSYGRGQLRTYGDSLMEAVRIWRSAGLWRARHAAVSLPARIRKPTISFQSRADNRVVYFQTRRPKTLPRPVDDVSALSKFDRPSGGKTRPRGSTG